MMVIIMLFRKIKVGKEYKYVSRWGTYQLKGYTERTIKVLAKIGSGYVNREIKIKFLDTGEIETIVFPQFLQEIEK